MISEGFYQKIGFINYYNEEYDELYELMPYYDYFSLYLNRVSKIDRGESFGRLAVSCAKEDIEKVYKCGAKKMKEPTVLKTKDKAEVTVTIIQSPDDHEFCFVDDEGFKELSKETGEKVDWERYDKIN